MWNLEEAMNKMVSVENMVLKGGKMGDYGETALLVLISGVIGLMLSKKLGEYSRKERFPPSPFGWPLIGHLPLLLNLPHQCLHSLSQKYGPIVGLRLGQQKAVAICSAELAKEVLSTHDKVLANRPPFDFTSVMLYGYSLDLLFSRHGPTWRKQRKLCSLSLFTPKRLQEFEYLRQQELSSLLLRLHRDSAGGVSPVDVGLSISEMSSHVVMRLLLSKASVLLGLTENMHNLIKEFEHQASFPTFGDLIPFLSFLDFPRKQQMRRLRERFDKAISIHIAEHKQSSAPLDDLLQALLNKEVGHDPSIPPQETFTLDEIKTIMLDMLSAGIHTTTSTLEWALAELLKNPHCFHRLREEIDTQLGRKKQITDADIPKLSYLKCVVKEVFRLHPVVPMLLPRFSFEECKVKGYTLPANTLVFVNVWAIQRDEALWPRANEFMPERFEGKDFDVKGQSYELLPFGSGRRICIGMPMALSVVDVTLANLVNSFDWELPNGESHTSMNMAEKNGITANKATPLMAIPKLRI